MPPYRPLDSARGEIRLLSIQPSTKQDSPIVCKLKHAHLSEKPKYECLSYVWGNEQGGTNISLDGLPFHVFENCEAALRRLRNRLGTRTVWIDAICINQSDNAEKSGQLRLMADIYQHAQQVCLWLGELTDGGIVAAKSIQGNMLTMGWHMWQVDRKFGKPTLPVRESLGSSIALQNRSSLVQDQELGEIKELLDRPWFTRVWIIQEAVLARKLVIMCGPEVMSWDRVGTVIRRFWITSGVEKVFGMIASPHHRFPDETYQVLCHFREKRAKDGLGLNLCQLLYDYRHLDCTKPHDRIYGFLGLTSATKDLGINPDYDLRPDEAYRSFARSVMEKTGCLDLLSCVREWKDCRVPFLRRPATAYSLIDQSRYHDLNAILTDGPEHATRRGWARLPPGWERIQDEGRPCYYRNHNDQPATDHETSPLEGGEPIPAQYFANQRSLPRGWTKTWNNLGQARVSFSPASLEANHDANRLEYQKKHSLDMLPSWVPNWAARTAWDPTPLLDWADPLPRYWASGKSSVANVAAASSDTDPCILEVEGFVFDTVETMACPWHPPADLIGPFSRKGIEELEIWEALAVVEHDDCPYSAAANGKGRPDALWRTLIADWAGDRAAPDEAGLFVETWYDRVGWQQEIPDLTSKSIWETAELADSGMSGHMMEHYVDLRAKTPAYEEYATNSSVVKILKDAFVEGVKVPDLYGEYLRRIRRACAHRAMFVSRRGYLGLAPWNAQEGDLICILKGAKTPFILRLPPAGSVYQIVGEAFVYGIMGSEAVGSGAANDWRMFSLR